MKEQYEPLELEVVEFEGGDVITESDPYHDGEEPET